MPSPVAELLAALGAAFERLGLSWYLFGAQAVVLYGGPRLTADVDVTVALGDCPTSALVEALAAAGFRPRGADVASFVERTRVLPALHEGTGMPVDVVLAGAGLEELFLQRARPRLVDGITVPVAAPEDIIAMKVLAGRPKDLEDAAAVLAANPDSLDPSLVRDTLGALELALDQRDLLPAFERLVAQRGR